MPIYSVLRVSTCQLEYLPFAADNSAGHFLDLPLWTVSPFVLMLLTIAILPLVAGRFWHPNRNKAVVTFLLGSPIAVYLWLLGPSTQGASIQAFVHEMQGYVSFILLLGSLYTISGGIVLEGDIQGKPATNAAFLAIGAILANVLGTTGASMLLIRPFLRINQQRRRVHHLPVFFIFIVSNLGGLLTPLGDPPLFLGFLRGVEFTWTLGLWRPWLIANGILLCLFWCCDAAAYRRETAGAIARDIAQSRPLRIKGTINFLFLAGVLAAVLFQSPQLSEQTRAILGSWFECPDLTLVFPWGEALMLAMGILSLGCTPRSLRSANAFNWVALIEVAVLFAGIFVTMIPALAILKIHGPKLGISEPWQFFWLTGGLSSFLDNAPTYLTFATLAAGPHDLSWLAQNRPAILSAISCGAVFMGANTYIGNGPNFMVKAIADQAGYQTPSFFGYMAWSGLILLPIFGLVTWLI